MLYGWIVCVCVSERSCGKRTVQVFPVIKKENRMCGGSRRTNVYMCVCVDLVCCADHSTL